MVQTISVSEARNNFSELLNQVYYQGKQFLVEKMGRSMAVLIRAEDLAKLAEQAGKAREGRFKKLFAIARENKEISFSQVKEDTKEALTKVRVRG